MKSFQVLTKGKILIIKCANIGILDDIILKNFNDNESVIVELR